MDDEHKPEIDLNLYIDELRELGLFIHDLENDIAYPNSFWLKLGYTAEDMRDTGFLRFVHPDDLAAVNESMVQKVGCSPENTGSRILFRIKSKSGEWFWVLSSSIGGRKGDDGKVLYYLGFDHDVTAEIEAGKKAEEALKAAESLMKATEIISANLDLKNTVDAILEQAENVFSFTSASVQLMKDDEFRIVGSVGLKEEFLNQVISFPQSPSIPNYRIVTDNKPYIVNSGLLDEYPDFLDGSVHGIKSWMGIPLIYNKKLLGVISFDYTEENHFDGTYIRLAQAFANHVSIALENSRMFEEIKALAIQDDLTGCYSRRHLFECLQSECEVSKRYGSPLSMIMFDIDDFKLFNDRFGHLVGDEILKKIAAAASGCLRRADIIGRYGGEEFVVLMPSTDLDEAVIVAERIRNTVENSVGFPVPVTISTGCTSMGPDDYGNIDAMLSRADDAMYESKAKGKNRTSVIKARG